MRGRVLALLLASLAPLGAPSAAPAPTAPRIVGGQITSAWPGVGALVAFDGSGNAIGLCSGTLLDALRVLTAAHCVDPGIGADGFGFAMGRDVSLPDAMIPIVGVALDPDWSGGIEHDLAVVTLAAPVVATTFAFDPGAIPPATGAPLHLMGYGATSPDGSEGGIRRVGTAAVIETTQSLLELGGDASACIGDSGGPAFVYGANGFPVLRGVIVATLDDCTHTIALRIEPEFDAFIAPLVPSRCRVDDDTASCDGLLRNGFESPPGHP